MTKNSNSSWFQLDSNAVCTVTHIRKIIVSKLAYVTYVPVNVLQNSCPAC